MSYTIRTETLEGNKYGFKVVRLRVKSVPEIFAARAFLKGTKETHAWSELFQENWNSDTHIAYVAVSSEETKMLLALAYNVDDQVIWRSGKKFTIREWHNDN